MQNGFDYIIARQRSWAANNEIDLMGSAGSRGAKNYTTALEQNLFEPLLPEVAESFSGGDGNEIGGGSGKPGKMQAVHSSSAIGVNIFQYWQRVGQPSEIAAACGLCRSGSDISRQIVFEDKFPIDSKFRFPPNIDVVFHNKSSARYKCFAVECKFSEAYRKSSGNHGMKPAYLALDRLWQDLPGLKKLAETISPEDDKFFHLHPAQLIKHILGLKEAYGKNGFRLMYRWYDVPGKEGVAHRDEIEIFAEAALSDGVKFHALSYQTLIARLDKKFRAEHGEYIAYITERYL